MEVSNAINVLPVKAPEAPPVPPKALKFTPNALDVHKEKCTHIELIVATLAEEKAKQCGSEFVSPRHVEMAWEQIAIMPRTLEMWLGNCGTLLLGAGLGNLLAILTSPGTNSQLGWILTASSMTLGALLFGFSLRRK